MDPEEPFAAVHGCTGRRGCGAAAAAQPSAARRPLGPTKGAPPKGRGARHRALRVAMLLCAATPLAIVLAHGGPPDDGPGCACDPGVSSETCASECRRWRALVAAHRLRAAPGASEGLGEKLALRVGLHGRAVVAGRDIARGEVLLRVVGPQLLTMGTCRNHSGAVLALAEAEASGVLAYVSPHTRLALHVLEERARGAASPFSEYLAALPAAYNIPALTRATDSGPLSTTSLARRARHHRADLEAQHADVVKVLGAAAPSLADFLWARAAIGSRVFDGHRIQGLERGEGEAMVPLGDMLNHAQGEARNIDVEPGSQGYGFRANRDLSAGEQLLMSYGRNSAGEWLLHYGFTPEGNNPEAARLRLYVQMEEGMPLQRQKTAFLRSLRSSADPDADLPAVHFDLSAADDTAYGKLIAHLRFVLASDAEDLTRRMEDGQACRPYAEPVACPERISDANEKEVFAWLQRRFSTDAEAAAAALAAEAVPADARRVLEEEQLVRRWWLARMERELAA